MALPEIIKDIDARVKDTGDEMTGSLVAPLFLGYRNETTGGITYGIRYNVDTVPQSGVGTIRGTYSVALFNDCNYTDTQMAAQLGKACFYYNDSDPYQHYPNCLSLNNGEINFYKASNGNIVRAQYEEIPMEQYTVFHSGNYTSFLDGRYINASGDTVTGNLFFGTTSTVNGPSLCFRSNKRNYIWAGFANDNGSWYLWDSHNNKGIITSTVAGINSFYGNADTATKLSSARTISLTGDVTGSGTFDGSANLSITTTVADNSHNHTSFSGNLSIAGNLSVGTSRQVQFKTDNDLYFVNKSLNWNASSYYQWVYLLCPCLTATNQAINNYLAGTFYLYKIGANIFDEVYVNINNCYNGLRYYIDSHGDYGSGWHLVTCKYNGIKYYALRGTYHANPYNRTQFVGHVKSDLPGGTSTLALPYAVPYYNENTATVLNSEIYNSLSTTLTDTYTTYQGIDAFRCNGGIYGAVWNDYAEFRKFKDSQDIPYGRVVIENGDDSLSLSTHRLQKGGNIVSDTFGFAIGETEESKLPIAVSGRVLAYPNENRYAYGPGDAVCTGPNGTVSVMTEEEIRNYPDRIIGYVSAVPDYEIWGTGNVKVDGRIWIKVK